MLSQTLYQLGVYIARPILAAAAPLSPKLRKGMHGRRNASDRLIAWAASHRDTSRPLIWLHAPSVGESLMTQAIITELRALRPEVQIAFTHFSPSAERVAQSIGADVVDYLPWDTQGVIDRTIQALRPSAIAFVRTEIWPTIVHLAAERSIPTTLVNAALAVNSSRLRGTSRWMLAPSYQKLDRIGAIARGDAERFARLGVAAERVSLTGDARFDQVFQRIQNLDHEQPLLQRLRDPRVTTVVAGSTWPTDEAELLPAFANARKGSPMRLIIAPHEPDAPHLRSLEEKLADSHLKHARLSEVENNSRPLPEVVIVDRIGVLADLYAIATVAYVGGGFHGAGLHSVIEPAALGVPVIFGPRHGNAREADELSGNGGGFVASDGVAFASLVKDLADRPLHRGNASSSARAFVQSKLGGAKRNAELIVGLIR